jgi:hypothetical protein
MHDSSDYKKLKNYTTNELCPKIYRKRFRGQTKVGNETYADFAYKLALHFKRWVQGCGAFDKLDLFRELMLLEQYMEMLPNDLKLWLTDQKPTI